MPARSARRPSAGNQTSPSTSGRTQGKSPFPVLCVANASAAALTASSTRESTRGRSLTLASSAADPSSAAPIAFHISAPTLGRNRIRVPSAESASETVLTSISTRGPTLGKGHFPAPRAGRALCVSRLLCGTRTKSSITLSFRALTGPDFVSDKFVRKGLSSWAFPTSSESLPYLLS